MSKKAIVVPVSVVDKEDILPEEFHYYLVDESGKDVQFDGHLVSLNWEGSVRTLEDAEDWTRLPLGDLINGLQSEGFEVERV